TKKRGFTLIELLLVIVIIVVLSGLVLSGIHRVHAEANSIRCLSNLRRWGEALNLYANDNDGYYPRRGQGVQLVTQIDRPTDWFNALPPYLGLPSYYDLVKGGKRFTPRVDSFFVCPSCEDPGTPNFLPYA